MTPVSHDDLYKTVTFNRRAVRAGICWRDGATLYVRTPFASAPGTANHECPECGTRFRVDAFDSASTITEYSPLPPGVDGKPVAVIGTDPDALVHADGRPYTSLIIRAPVYYRSEW